MSRLFLLPVVALVAVVAPSIAHAQYAVVSPCSVDTYNCARISIVPAPPTGLPAWLQPKPAPPVWGPPAPVYVPPAPIYLPPAPIYLPPPVSIAPMYVAPPAPRGIDPWIPLAIQPAPVARPSDVLNQLLLFEALAARRAQPAPAPVPYVTTPYVAAPAPAPAPPRAPGDNWMSAWVKGVN